MASIISALLKSTTIDDHEEVLKACNAALKQAKNDSETQHVKAVALLNLDRFDDALRVFEEGAGDLKTRAPLEYAYALYKNGKLEQARDVAKGLAGRGARHVEAQACYRLEDFSAAASLYKALTDGNDHAVAKEESDLRINGSATDAQLEWKMQGDLVVTKRPGRLELEAFETAYNAACGYIARGELGQGEILLRRARDLCLSSEDLTEAEKQVELLPIDVQLLYVLSSQGKGVEAEALAAEITVDSIPDSSTRQIAQANKLVAASHTVNPYLSHRLLRITPLPSISDQLYGFQDVLVKQNEVASNLLAAKFSGVAQSTAKLLQEHSSPTLSPGLNAASAANAAAHAQNALGKLGLQAILPLLEKRPRDVGLVATIVQLYILTGNHGAAIAILESFFKRLGESSATTDEDVRFAPGLVAMMVSLYSIEGRNADIRTELVKAASYWRHKSKSPSGLLGAAGLSLIKSGKPGDLEEAAAIFDGLRQLDPKSRLATAGFVASHATKDPSTVASEADKLTAVSRLVADVDVAMLEKVGMPQAAFASTLLSRKREAEASKPNKKRFRRSRLPKDYDRSKQPDPERWLPLRDRSTYRPKGKKGRQKVAASTQGGISEKGSENLSVAAGDGSAKPASPLIGNGGGKAKKKKSKK